MKSKRSVREPIHDKEVEKPLTEAEKAEIRRQVIEVMKKMR